MGFDREEPIRSPSLASSFQVWIRCPNDASWWAFPLKPLSEKDAIPSWNQLVLAERTQVEFLVTLARQQGSGHLRAQSRSRHATVVNSQRNGCNAPLCELKRGEIGSNMMLLD